MKRRVSSLLTAMFLVVALVGLFGCQSVSSYFVGRTVEPELRIPLTVGASQKGTWKTFDILVNYSVEMNVETLSITGHAELGDHYQAIYNRIAYLNVYLFFLDDASTVLETVLLARSLSTNIDGLFNFDKKLTLPHKATMIAFGYDGEVIETGGDEDPDAFYWFYKLPLN